MNNQITIFDLIEVIEIDAYEPQLTDLENEIKSYVYSYHKGKKNGISMSDLAIKFNVSERKVRDLMERITKKSVIDFDSGDDGYFACEAGEPRDWNRVKRALGMIRRICEGYPKRIEIFYKELNTLKNELR
ncbi:MAG: hypothetical protein QXM38_04675 [Candidatus Aenigmatarchaeota archaeon]